MVLASSVVLIFVFLTMVTKATFDKRYENTEVIPFIKKCFRGALYLLIIIWCVFVYDLLNLQYKHKLDGIAAFVTLIISPILVIFGFLIGHIFYIALFTFIDFIVLKIYGKNRDFLLSVMFATVFMVVILEIIWWKLFYTDVSIFMRIIGWNLIIIFFPFISIFYAISEKKK